MTMSANPYTMDGKKSRFEELYEDANRRRLHFKEITESSNIKKNCTKMRQVDWEMKWSQMMKRHQEKVNYSEYLKTQLEKQRDEEMVKECTFKPKSYTNSFLLKSVKERTAILNRLEELARDQNELRNRFEIIEEEEKATDKRIQDLLESDLLEVNDPEGQRMLVDFYKNKRNEEYNGFLASKLEVLNELTKLENIFYKILSESNISYDQIHQEINYDDDLLQTIKNQSWYTSIATNSLKISGRTNKLLSDVADRILSKQSFGAKRGTTSKFRKHSVPATNSNQCSKMDFNDLSRVGKSFYPECSVKGGRITALNHFQNDKNGMNMYHNMNKQNFELPSDSEISNKNENYRNRNYGDIPNNRSNYYLKNRINDNFRNANMLDGTVNPLNNHFYNYNYYNPQNYYLNNDTRLMRTNMNYPALIYNDQDGKIGPDPRNSNSRDMRHRHNISYDSKESIFEKPITTTSKYVTDEQLNNSEVQMNVPSLIPKTNPATTVIATKCKSTQKECTTNTHNTKKCAPMDNEHYARNSSKFHLGVKNPHMIANQRQTFGTAHDFSDSYKGGQLGLNPRTSCNPEILPGNDNPDLNKKVKNQSNDNQFPKAKQLPHSAYTHLYGSMVNLPTNSPVLSHKTVNSNSHQFNPYNIRNMNTRNDHFIQNDQVERVLQNPSLPVYHNKSNSIYGNNVIPRQTHFFDGNLSRSRHLLPSLPYSYNPGPIPYQWNTGAYPVNYNLHG